MAQQQWNQQQWGSPPPSQSPSPSPQPSSLADKNAAYIAMMRKQQSKSTEPKFNEPQKKINLFGANNELLAKAAVKQTKKKSKWVQLPDTGLTEPQLRTKYQIQSAKIGSGSFSKVKIIKEHQTGRQYAIKMVKTRGKAASDINAFKREILFLSKLTNHPNIVKMYDFCESPTTLYMVLEYCNGGDVLQKMAKCKTLKENEARHLSKQIVAGLSYSHQFNIVHRDLKPDNLMFHNGVLKIIDFGLAGDCTDKPLNTPCGSPQYVAPEVLNNEPYTTKADMWSLGIIIFYFISGFLPFQENEGNKQKLFQIIKTGKFSFPPKFFNQCSADIKELINQLICKNVEQRLTAQQVRNHKWLQQNNKPYIPPKQPQNMQNQWSKGNNMNNNNNINGNKPRFGGPPQGNNNVNRNRQPFGQKNNMNNINMQQRNQNFGPNNNMNKNQQQQQQQFGGNINRNSQGFGQQNNNQNQWNKGNVHNNNNNMNGNKQQFGGPSQVNNNMNRNNPQFGQNNNANKPLRNNKFGANGNMNKNQQQQFGGNMNGNIQRFGGLPHVQRQYNNNNNNNINNKGKNNDNMNNQFASNNMNNKGKFVGSPSAQQNNNNINNQFGGNNMNKGGFQLQYNQNRKQLNNNNNNNQIQTGGQKPW